MNLFLKVRNQALVRNIYQPFPKNVANAKSEQSEWHGKSRKVILKSLKCHGKKDLSNIHKIRAGMRNFSHSHVL